MKRRLLLSCFSLFLICPDLSLSALALASGPAETAGDHTGTAIIELISGKKTVEIKGASGTRSASRGDKILAGDSISTDTETVVLTLPHGNELQLAPHTTLQVEEFADAQGKRDVLLLQNGIVWGLIAVGHSLSEPLYLRTAEVTISVPAASFVVEYIPASHSFSVLTLEGTVKVAPSIGELSDVKKSTFVSASFRSFSVGSRIGAPKKFKRNLLISYLARKAKEMAQDMANRGNRLLTVIAKKQRPLNATDDDITWSNIPPQPLVTGPTGNGMTPNGPNNNNYYSNGLRGGVDANARTGTGNSTTFK